MREVQEERELDKIIMKLELEGKEYETTFTNEQVLHFEVPTAVPSDKKENSSLFGSSVIGIHDPTEVQSELLLLSPVGAVKILSYTLVFTNKEQLEFLAYSDEHKVADIMYKFNSRTDEPIAVITTNITNTHMLLKMIKNDFEQGEE